MDYDSPMQLKVSSKPIDILTSSLNWLVLLGLTLSVASINKLSPGVSVLLAGAALWNVVYLLLVVFDRPWQGLHILNIFIALFIASWLFYISGAFGGNIVWTGLLAILPASIHLPLLGVLLVALAALVLQGLIAVSMQNILFVGVYLAYLTVVYGGVGVIFSRIAQHFNRMWSQIENERLAAIIESERVGRERYQTIYKLVSDLSATLNYNRVLEVSLDLAYQALVTGEDIETQMVSAVLLYEQEGNQSKYLKLRLSRRFTQADLRLSIPGADGLVGRAIEDGTSKHGQDLHNDPELGRVIALKTCSSGYCIPLRAGLDTYGVLLFAHPMKEFFNEERREILDILGRQAVAALQNAVLYQDLELEKERVIDVQEEARKKLARDLHDGPTQSIAALAMRVNFARRLVEQDPKAAIEELHKIEELARRTSKEIRHMLFTLRPLIFESQGLIAALNSMADKTNETYAQNINVEVDPDLISKLETGKQGVIFYIIEEAVNNSRKHAHAEHIWVRLREMGEDLALLEIEDDGIGFDAKRVEHNYEQRSSLGMINLRERSELVNGHLQIDSAVGRGTTIRVVIPMTEDAAGRLRLGLDR